MRSRLGSGYASLPLQWQMGLLVLVGLLLVFAPFVWLGAVLAEEEAEQMKDERLKVAQLTAEFLDESMAEVIKDVQVAAAASVVVVDDHERAQRVLSDFLVGSRPFITDAVMVDATGRSVATSPSSSALADTDLASQDYVATPLTTRQVHVSGIYARGPARQPVIAVAAPIMADVDTPVGVVVATLDPRAAPFDVVQRSAAHLGSSGHAELVDQRLRLIASSEPERVLGPAEHPSLYLPLVAQHAHGVGVTDPIDGGDRPDRSERHIMAFVPLSTVPWGLGVGGSEAAFTTYVDRWRWQMLPLGCLLLGTVVFLVWTTSRTVVTPLRALTASAQRIADGDLATPVPPLGNGEVRGLAEAFDAMRDRLRESLEALASEKSRYEAIVEFMADAVLTTDLGQRVTAMNPAAETLTGWPRETALAQPCAVIAVAGDKAKDTLHRPDGRAVTVSVARSPILGRDGTPKGWVYVLHDVSAEEELGLLKDQFLATVSHELRTPLGCIKGYATTLLAKPQFLERPQVIRKSLRVIVGASDELHELVDNLLDMSKIGAGTFGVDLQPVRVRPLARIAMQRLRPRARAPTVCIDIPVSLPPVQADSHRIEQVLYNLLDNALKYAPGGDITLSATAAGDDVMVSVADTGPGIAPDELSHVFERFYRGKAARSGISGSGLGLAVCRGVVEAHGGRIWVESGATQDGTTAGLGTVVCFTLRGVPNTNGRSHDDSNMRNAWRDQNERADG